MGYRYISTADMTIPRSGIKDGHLFKLHPMAVRRLPDVAVSGALGAVQVAKLLATPVGASYTCHVTPQWPGT